MSDSQTAVDLVRALAWPTVTLTSVLVLRNQLRALITGIGQRISKIKIGDFEAQFDRVAAETEAVLGVDPAPRKAGPIPQSTETSPEPLTSSSDPTAVVLAAYERLGEALRQLLRTAGLGEAAARASRPLQLAMAAQQHGLITSESVEAVRGVTVMRNLVAHGQGSMDASKALDYVALIDATIFSFRQRPDAGAPPNPPADPTLGL